MIEAHADRQRFDYEMSITAAFYSAYFSRMEKLGSQQLDSVLRRKPKPTPQQTDEQIAQSVMAWLRHAEKVNNADR